MTDPADHLSARLSPEMEALTARVLAEDGPGVDATLYPAAEGRALVKTMSRRWMVPELETAATYEVTVPMDAMVGNVPVRCVVHKPKGTLNGVILFDHGGGFAFSDPERHSRCAILLAQAAGMATVLPDYRLAPEHPYPAGLEDAVATLRAVSADPAAFGLNAGTPIVLAGDSAGANLALASLLHPLGGRQPHIAGAVLFYGVYAADFTTPSYRRFHDGPGLTTPKMRRYWDWYLPDPARRGDPLVTPIHASDAALQALPPLYLTAAGVDPLLFDTLLLAERLKAAGRNDPVHIEPGVVHGYLQMTNSLEAARKTLSDAGAAARNMITPD